MPEFAVAFEVPLTDTFRLTRLSSSMREGTRCTSCTGPCLEETARNVTQVLGYTDIKVNISISLKSP